MRIPDRKEIINKLNKKTEFVWFDETKRIDTLYFTSKNYNDENSPYNLLIEWDDDRGYWTLKLFDENYNENEPKWALGPLKNAKSVENELNNFIPSEI